MRQLRNDSSSPPRVISLDSDDMAQSAAANRLVAENNNAETTTSASGTRRQPQRRASQKAKGRWKAQAQVVTAVDEAATQSDASGSVFEVSHGTVQTAQRHAVESVMEASAVEEHGDEEEELEEEEQDEQEEDVEEEEDVVDNSSEDFGRARKRPKRTGKSRALAKDTTQSNTRSSDKAQTNTEMGYALRVGPSLQHASSTTLSWAALQVQQDNALLLASLLRYQLSHSASSTEAATWRQQALQHAERVERRYTGENDIASIREPYAELREHWRRLHADPVTSPFMRPGPSHSSVSSTAQQSASTIHRTAEQVVGTSRPSPLHTPELGQASELQAARVQVPSSTSSSGSVRRPNCKSSKSKGKGRASM